MLKKLQEIFKMKKVIFLVFIIFIIPNGSSAENFDRNKELDKLFTQLKSAKDLLSAQVIENEILEIWSVHPSDDRRGFRLTELLTQGTRLMNMRELSKAYEIFTKVITVESDWAEAWNKRATVLYLMKQYESSLADIEITLVLEPRHFGALSGQALNYIELNLYEKAIESYKSAQKIYPLLDSAKKMIPELQELINDQAI